MSNMLEQAIVDAEALKEAALQNAEQAVIEKYQSEIKNAVEALLEQDEEDPLEEPLDDEDGLESDEDLNLIYYLLFPKLFQKYTAL